MRENWVESSEVKLCTWWFETERGDDSPQFLYDQFSWWFMHGCWFAETPWRDDPLRRDVSRVIFEKLGLHEHINRDIAQESKNSCEKFYIISTDIVYTEYTNIDKYMISIFLLIFLFYSRIIVRSKKF